MTVVDTSAYEDQALGGAMIALLPITSDWCKIELPHLTLVYAGEVKDLQPTDFNELAKDASMLATLTNPLTLSVAGTDSFGDGELRVDVLVMKPTPELLAMRRIVDRWNASQYPFRPHCTIGPPGSAMSLGMTPRFVAFDRVCVEFGQESLVFRMGQSNRY
jgi:2'-5' RNA ligase